ncbi:MAG: hypothetical protein PHD76_14545 [Methylacidiphilales bacterium]|nr:hypothetical protein [Candidatus Methylacidiphilales bacterium]
MNTRIATLLGIFAIAICGSAKAQTITLADLHETEAINLGSKILTATGAVPDFTLSQVGVTSPVTVISGSSPGAFADSLNVELSPSGLITLSSTGAGTNIKVLTITIDNLNYTPGYLLTGISGLPDLNAGALSPTPSPFTITPTLNSPTSVSITYNGGAGVFTTQSLSGALGPNESFFQLDFTAVPEPRQWACIVLLGAMGLMLARKFRDRLAVSRISA